MFGFLLSKKNSTLDGVNASKSTTQDRKQSSMVRNIIVRRQRLSEEAHVQRNCREHVLSKNNGQIKGKPMCLLQSVNNSAQVHGLESREEAVNNNISQKHIVTQISFATNATWRAVRYEYAASITTYISDGGHDDSTPEPGSDEDRGATPETGRTSSCGSENWGEFVEALKQTKEATTLQERLEDTVQQLRMHKERYQNLETRFEVQRSQRTNDKAKVDDAYEQYQDAVERYENLQSELEATEQRLNFQLRAKDRALAKLEHDQACTVAALVEAHTRALASKDAEIQITRERGQQENATLQKAYEKVVAERDEIKRKANNEKRKIWSVEKSKRTVLVTEKDRLEARLNQSTADFDDAITTNEETIISLTARNIQLENEHEVMARMLIQKHPSAKELETVINGNDADKEMQKGNRAQIKHLKEQNENILDSLEQMRGHCSRHQEAEQEARHEANHLHREIDLLMETAAVQKRQFRDVVKQLESIQQGSIPAGGHCTALDIAEEENEELRNRLQATLNENTEVQTKLNRLADENLRQAIDLDFKDDAIIEKEQAITSLEKSTEAVMQELRMLRKVTSKKADIVIDGEEKQDFLAYLSKTTDENKELIEENAKLCQEFEKIQQWGQPIVDKCDTEVRKARTEAAWAANLYHTEAVPINERLHNEIAALKAEKGETYFVEPFPYPNPEVAERKIMPYACLDGLDGVPPELVPAAARDPNLRPLVSATVDALISLRPQGYYPLLVGGKVWLKRLIEPFYEADAVQRIRQGQVAWNATRSSASSGHSVESSNKI